MKPVAMSPKPAPEEPRLCYQSSIETSIKTSNLIEQALGSKVTPMTRELLPTSPEIRRHVKDLATSEKVSANVLEEDPVDSYLNTFFEEDPVNSYLSTFFEEDPASSCYDAEKYSSLSLSESPSSNIYSGFSDFSKSPSLPLPHHITSPPVRRMVSVSPPVRRLVSVSPPKDPTSTLTSPLKAFFNSIPHSPTPLAAFSSFSKLRRSIPPLPMNPYTPLQLTSIWPTKQFSQSSFIQLGSGSRNIPPEPSYLYKKVTNKTRPIQPSSYLTLSSSTSQLINTQELSDPLDHPTPPETKLWRTLMNWATGLTPMMASP